MVEILSSTIKELARKQGRDLSSEYGNDIDAFLKTLEFWTQDGALEINVLEKSKTRLNFDVTRCKYAEFYKAMGMEDLGAILSCNRDFAMIEGFNERGEYTGNYKSYESWIDGYLSKKMGCNNSLWFLCR